MRGWDGGKWARERTVADRRNHAEPSVHPDDVTMTLSCHLCSLKQMTKTALTVVCAINGSSVLTQLTDWSDVATAQVLSTSGGTRLCPPAAFRDEGFPHPSPFGSLTYKAFRP